MFSRLKYWFILVQYTQLKTNSNHLHIQCAYKTRLPCFCRCSECGTVKLWNKLLRTFDKSFSTFTRCRSHLIYFNNLRCSQVLNYYRINNQYFNGFEFCFDKMVVVSSSIAIYLFLFDLFYFFFFIFWRGCRCCCCCFY